MDSVNHDNHTRLQEAFAELLSMLDGAWPEADVAYVREEVGHGEYGDALDNLIAIGLNNDCGFDRRQRELIETLADAMHLTDSEFLAELRHTPATGGMSPGL